MCPSTAFHSVFLIIATVDGSASFFKSDNMALRAVRERWQHYEVDSGRGSLVAHPDVGAACLGTASPVLPPCWGSAGIASPAWWHRSLSPPSPAATASPSHPVPSHTAGLGLAVLLGALGGRQAGTRTRALAWGEKLEVKCLKVRSLFSMNLLYLILSTNSNLIASGLKPLQ